MNTSNQCMVGLVELADAEELLDRLGKSSFGDVQQAFFQRLQDWVRPRDEWQRLDENRCCVVLHGVGTRGELELATSKLERMFAEPHYQYGRPVALNIRAGFTGSADPDKGREQALRQASMALRQARKGSRIYDVYAPQKTVRAAAEQKLLERLENAVEMGELQLYYQPKIHASYRSLVGAEALMRWHTSDRKVIPPGQFIAVAECHEVIRPMTFWAVKSAVARLARWPEELSIAVNITPQLLLDGQLASVVSDALDIHGVAPARLVLEVTERIMVANQTTMMEQLAAMRLRGVQVSLDDFGTGFSSLSYFRDLPVDEIKIDGSFVLKMLESGKDHAIVKAVIDLAHNFSMRVVAEGVESSEIAERLQDLGCDILQGYVFDRPLEASTFEASYGIARRDPRRRQPVENHPII
ncbi:EAL domain-containing protein [Seongchinamella sediminis]|uniref:EAL domain-containing protein n=1 Tax=Seongchinamella sediminis TaxID=2283635 RepID=A0A3L7DWX0_9GAMM|nr:GGDEF domain-containing phosphodiesterase [Seongchinamella sediminis]RLQ21814.1 EAL domain-containing protein [Seongchinamella sediminis]